MAARSASPVAVFILVIGLGLLANPLYLTTAPDRGSLLIGADRIPPAEGAAMLSPAAERQDDLQPVARYAARRALENGSITLNRSGPPLALQLFASKWRYLGSQQRTAVYRPTVEVGARSTTLRVKNVSLKTVESELGLTPPGRLNETDHPKEVAWLTHESDDVVGVGEFGRPWETRLERAIERGELTVPNGNNASMLHPLGSDVHFVVREDRFHRVALEETGTNVRLKVRSVSNETALAETNVSVVAASDLPSDIRSVVLDAIRAEDGYVRASHEDVNVSRVHSTQEQLIRQGGDYYVLRRGHVDDFDLTPLFRIVLTGIGIIAVLVGLGLELRARFE